MNENNKDFFNKFNELFKLKNITEKDIAELTGFCRFSVHEYKSKNVSPREKTLTVDFDKIFKKAEKINNDRQQLIDELLFYNLELRKIFSIKDIIKLTGSTHSNVYKWSKNIVTPSKSNVKKYLKVYKSVYKKYKENGNNGL